MIKFSLTSALVSALSLSSVAQAEPQLAHTISSPTVAAAASNCQLKYGGGPILQQVKVFDVFYSKANPYKEKLEGFYKFIVQSPHVDWLSEYNVGSYKIGRGSFLGSFEDTHEATTTDTIDASQIGPYLDKLIAAKSLPEPDDNTIYQIYFPASATLTLQGGRSCASGGFCAYHFSWKHNGKVARFSAIADTTSGGCATGCGKSKDPFENLSEVSSHELIEAITDPDDNSAWVDNAHLSCGEIGDICNGQGGKVGDYMVQKEWSNKNNSCILTDPNAKVNSFTVSAAPTTLSVPAGGMATAMLTLAKTAGDAENVTLSATAATGLTAAVAPSSVSSDKGSATLTVTASPSAMVGSMQKVTVKADGTSSATVEVNVTVTAPADMAVAPDLATAGAGGSSSGGGASGGKSGGPTTHTDGKSGGCAYGLPMAAPTAGSASWLLALLPLARRRRRR